MKKTLLLRPLGDYPINRKTKPGGGSLTFTSQRSTAREMYEGQLKVTHKPLLPQN